MENVRIWKANGPVKRAMGFGKEPVWFEIDGEKINALANTHPENYLAILNAWMHMLFGQSHYRIDENGLLRLVCVGVETNGKLSLLEFTFERKGDELLLVGTDTSISKGKWLSVKKQGRKM